MPRPCVEHPRRCGHAAPGPDRRACGVGRRSSCRELFPDTPVVNSIEYLDAPGRSASEFRPDWSPRPEAALRRRVQNAGIYSTSRPATPRTRPPSSNTRSSPEHMGPRRESFTTDRHLHLAENPLSGEWRGRCADRDVGLVSSRPSADSMSSCRWPAASAMSSSTSYSSSWVPGTHVRSRRGAHRGPEPQQQLLERGRVRPQPLQLSRLDGTPAAPAGSESERLLLNPLRRTARRRLGRARRAHPRTLGCLHPPSPERR